MQQQGTISQVIVTGDKKWILFDNWQRPAQWLDQEEAPKALPKTRLAQKRSWSLSGGLLLIFSFLNTGKALTSEKYAQQSMRCTENHDACSQD